MHTPHRRRRAVAVAASGALATALAWVPAGPADAAVHSTFVGGGSSQSTFTGTGGPNACLLTSGDDSVSTAPVSFSAGTRRRTIHINATYTSTANSSDVTTVAGHYRGTLHMSKHLGDLTGFTLDGVGDVTVTRALGSSSECRTGAILGVQADSHFTEGTPGWLYLTRDTEKPAETVFFAVNAATNQPVVVEEFVGGASSATERGFVTPGSYDVPEWLMALVAGHGSGLARSGRVQRSSVDTRMTGKFYSAGAAFGGAHGAASAFVRFPGSISCGHRTAKLTWTGKAGRVARGAFSVNGGHRVAVKNPQAGHFVVLRHLSRTADNAISATLSLRDGSKAAASRAYVPCTG